MRFKLVEKRVFEADLNNNQTPSIDNNQSAEVKILQALENGLPILPDYVKDYLRDKFGIQTSKKDTASIGILCNHYTNFGIMSEMDKLLKSLRLLPDASVLSYIDGLIGSGIKVTTDSRFNHVVNQNNYRHFRNGQELLMLFQNADLLNNKKMLHKFNISKEAVREFIASDGEILKTLDEFNEFINNNSLEHSETIGGYLLDNNINISNIISSLKKSDYSKLLTTHNVNKINKILSDKNNLIRKQIFDTKIPKDIDLESLSKIIFDTIK